MLMHLSHRFISAPIPVHKILWVAVSSTEGLRVKSRLRLVATRLISKNSPMSLATELNLISREVECHSLKNCINPSEGLLGVFFHTELQQAVNKADTVPALMKQMALQLINEIPGVDIQIYTDGSKNEENQSQRKKNKDLKTWRVPPSHDWYKRSSPGGSIGLACDRADQTALSRFVSGHLRSCSFSHGNKVFPVCAKCGVASASPEHILSCLRLSRETFETDPLLALDFLRVSGLMDGV
ncbi:hypothetical protein AVEN_118695-1 [Araneus ventricosus]|uniref:RNase H type-1 domain-containing protein n=1 Tax=Araneus ventricosus TaxID=182803 RepID=A0A4Y2AWV1_ARAVE|nr:hypothetical protein AVEN_118695-1 [Araneus ventricosus]